MNEHSTKILNIIGLFFSHIDELNGLLVPREDLLSAIKYEEIKKLIPKLKAHYSSSCMTCLQETATISQKWPLLNLVRQILHAHNYNMCPVRKSDGYTLDGIKKYKRYFLIQHVYLETNVETNEDANEVKEKDRIQQLEI